MSAHEFDCLCRDCLKRDVEDPRPSAMRIMALAEALLDQPLSGWGWEVTHVLRTSGRLLRLVLMRDGTDDPRPEELQEIRETLGTLERLVVGAEKERASRAGRAAAIRGAMLPTKAPPSMPPLHHGASYNE